MKRLRQAWELLHDTFVSWLEDYAPSMGAALAYYTMFSIAPLLLIVIALAGAVFGEATARASIIGELRSLMGADGAQAVEALLVGAQPKNGGLVTTLGGLVVLVIGATSVFAELQNAVDRIWRVPLSPQRANVLTLLRKRLLSLGLILGIGFLLIVSLVTSAAITALGQWWAPMFGEAQHVARSLDFVFSFALITCAFAMIYKWMPQVRLRWRDVWIGASVTALLFTIGKLAIGTYLGRSGIATGFGAAAALVAMVVWVYYSAQVFLLGVEFTWIYARRYGSLRGTAPGAGPVSGNSVGATSSSSALPGSSSPATLSSSADSGTVSGGTAGGSTTGVRPGRPGS